MTSFDSLISATVGVFRAFRSCVSSWTATEVWRAAKEDPSWAASINMAHIGKHLRRIIYTWFTPLIQDTINIFTCRKIVFWLIARCRSCTTHVACSHIGSHHTPRPRRLKTHALMHLTHLMRKVRCKPGEISTKASKWAREDLYAWIESALRTDDWYFRLSKQNGH